jgi:hypothetical protein
MIAPRIRRVRMNQNAQCSMIEHQPRHQGGKHVRGKGDLKHRLIMRTHFHVMPTSQGDGEALTYPTAKLLGLRTRRRRIVIDVSMIACDFVYRSRCQHFRQISQLGTFFSLPSYPARGARSMAARSSIRVAKGMSLGGGGAARVPRALQEWSIRILSIYRRMPKSKARAGNYLERLRERSGYAEGAIDHLAG